MSSTRPAPAPRHSVHTPEVTKLAYEAADAAHAHMMRMNALDGAFASGATGTPFTTASEHVVAMLAAIMFEKVTADALDHAQLVRDRMSESDISAESAVLGYLAELEEQAKEAARKAAHDDMAEELALALSTLDVESAGRNWTLLERAEWLMAAAPFLAAADPLNA